MAAVAGTFVKIEPVATRKVVRLHIECPIEQANDILAALGGYPDPANARWVGVAPLKGQPENTLKGGKLAQAAGILCTEGAFRQWASIIGKHGIPELTEEEAADFIREYCGVSTRAHLDHNDDAAQIFRELRREYEAWLRVSP